MSKNTINIYKNYNFILIIIIVIILIIISLLIYKFIINNNGVKKEFFEIVSIPKIIHQTAPSDKSKWHSDWFICQESWKKHFPDFEYKMWTDEDNLKLIETDYPWFLETYKKYPKKINRIDIIRYFILHKYGGIYADMDYMCFKNFYNKLPKDKISISESPFRNHEYLQNALMCSPANQDFWLKVISKSKERIDKNDNIHHVLYISGPQLISEAYNENKNIINVLPINEFNPDKNSPEFNDHDKLFTKHICTATWVE